MPRASCTAARVSLGAVAPTVLLVPDAAKALIGTKMDEDGAGRAGRGLLGGLPADRRQARHREFRIKVAGVLARRAAQIARKRAGGK